MNSNASAGRCFKKSMSLCTPSASAVESRGRLDLKKIMRGAEMRVASTPRMIDSSYFRK